MEDVADSSGVASRNSIEQEQTSTNLMTNEPSPMEWTDEKHMMFLKSMEATFVNQLHKSLDKFGLHSTKKDTSDSKPLNHKRNSVCAPSGQFKVLHEGRWSKIDFGRDETEVNQEEKPRAPLESQWIQHYRSSERRAIRKSHTNAPLASVSNQYPANNFQLWRKDSQNNQNNNTTEGTDQNFINDEDREEENASRTHEIKRTKTSNTVTSTDQVVPFGNITRANNVATPPED